MDVNAIVQANQNQQSAAAQDSGGGATAADMFADLLKHAFGSHVGRHTLINAQAVVDMVGTPQAYTPPPQAAQAATAQTQQATTRTQSNQPANTGNQNNQPAANPDANTVNNNDNRNSGSGAQSNGGSSQNQQDAANGNAANSGGTQGAAAAGPANQAGPRTGEDQATEETAAVMAAGIYVGPQAAKTATPVDPVAAAAAAKTAATGPQQQATGPTTDPTAGQAAQRLAAAADDEAAPDDAHAWSANFLSSGPANPQTAQQAADLSKITGQDGAKISVQTTTGNTSVASSTGTLVPEAVTALPGFFTGDQQGASTGGDTGHQQTGQQTNDNAPQAVIDPNAQVC
jgi:hypothetical protein